jgi:hypothetical protein
MEETIHGKNPVHVFKIVQGRKSQESVHAF